MVPTLYVPAKRWVQISFCTNIFVILQMKMRSFPSRNKYVHNRATDFPRAWLSAVKGTPFQVN